MSESPVTQQQRATLAGLADVLIPAGETMPSASEAGVAGPLLDGVLRVRDDLATDLRRVLDAASGVDPVEAVARLRDEVPDDFAVLSFVVAGGYLMDAHVARLLNYPFQEALPVDNYDYLRAIEDGLLDPVVERGPIYRPTPAQRLHATRSMR